MPNLTYGKIKPKDYKKEQQNSRIQKNLQKTFIGAMKTLSLSLKPLYWFKGALKVNMIAHYLNIYNKTDLSVLCIKLCRSSKLFIKKRNSSYGCCTFLQNN